MAGIRIAEHIPKIIPKTKKIIPPAIKPSLVLLVTYSSCSFHDKPPKCNIILAERKINKRNKIHRIYSHLKIILVFLL